jgi:AcrR family transcriptional regulator
MADKNRRILRAAADLFDRYGYAAVTTQQIADRADVAASTVFRYAQTKAELLIAVFNTVLADALGEGARAAARGGPVSAITALLQPVLDAAAIRPATAIYQRELMFGDGAGPYPRRDSR